MPAGASEAAWLGLFTALINGRLSKSQLISLPQMHERSHITISARSVTVNIQGVDENMKHLAIYVNIWHFANIQLRL